MPTTGRRICDILKSIRREIALRNGIDLEIPHCDFKGECAGTCPQCESEIAYLTEELRKKDNVIIDGIGEKFLENVEIEDSTEAASVYLNEVYKQMHEQDRQNSEAIDQLQAAKKKLEDELETLDLSSTKRVQVLTGIRNFDEAIRDMCK